LRGARRPSVRRPRTTQRGRTSPPLPEDGRVGRPALHGLLRWRLHSPRQSAKQVIGTRDR
jgi:hypothetical protein